MKTFAYVGAALVAGLLMGLTASSHAQEDAPGNVENGERIDFLGLIRARNYTTSYKMPFDISADRSYKEVDRIDELRTRIHISDLYGPLVEMTAHENNVVLWFKDGEDVIRNAILTDVTNELIHIERVPAKQISITYR